MALYSLLGTTYGGDGETNFGLPDLRGRAVVGHNPADPKEKTLGVKGGASTVKLDLTHIPAHTHMLRASTEDGDNDTANGVLFAKITSPSPANMYAPLSDPSVPLESRSIAVAGDSVPHNNMQPYLVLNYIIALFGTYPTRPD